MINVWVVEYFVSLIGDWIGLELFLINFYVIFRRFLKEFDFFVEKLVFYVCRLYEWFLSLGLWFIS